MTGDYVCKPVIFTKLTLEFLFEWNKKNLPNFDRSFYKKKNIRETALSRKKDRATQFSDMITIYSSHDDEITYPQLDENRSQLREIKWKARNKGILLKMGKSLQYNKRQVNLNFIMIISMSECII